MNVVYTCPNCGGDLQIECICTNPPQYRMTCFKCGWVEEEAQEDTIRIPYIPRNNQFNSFDLNSIPAPCRKCSNHPSNGGSGICHCTLGLQQMRW